MSSDGPLPPMALRGSVIPVRVPAAPGGLLARARGCGPPRARPSALPGAAPPGARRSALLPSATWRLRRRRAPEVAGGGRRRRGGPARSRVAPGRDPSLKSLRAAKSRQTVQPARRRGRKEPPNRPAGPVEPRAGPGQAGPGRAVRAAGRPSLAGGVWLACPPQPRGCEQGRAIPSDKQGEDTPCGGNGPVGMRCEVPHAA